jgi:peptidyl-prolyl cis-trans isomerase SurA
MRVRRGWAATLAALMAGAILAAAPARAEVVERVVATIDDDAIFLSELRRRAAPFLERVMAAPSEAQRMAAIEQLYSQLLERMVEEELFIQAADRMQVSVSRAEVDRAIANVQRQSGLADAQFWEAVRAQGFTPDQYRGDVRRQLLRLKVLNTRARGRVNITEEQVRERYEMQIARARRTSQFEAAQIFFEVPSGASATELADIRRRAQEVRDGLSDRTSFFAAGGMSIGTLSQGDLPPALEDALMNLEPGQISGIVRGPAGFHIFLLESRQQAAANVQPYQQVRMQIYQGMMEEAMARQEELFLEELRRQAVIDIRL